MNATLVDARSRLKRPPSLVAHRDERWLRLDGGTRRVTAAALIVLTISAAAHVVFVLIALLQAPHAPAPVEQAISVDVIKQMPTPDSKATKTAAPRAPTDEPPKPATPPAADTAAAARSAELASLKQELAALKEEAAAAAQPTQGLGTEQGRQATALPATTRDGDGDLVGYAAVVFSQLAKAKEIGGELGLPGTAGLRFSVDDRGAVTSLALVTSSGIGQLDEQALALVRKAAPFPAPPPGAQHDFTANVSFVAGPNK